MNKDELFNDPFSICAWKIQYCMAFSIPVPRHERWGGGKKLAEAGRILPKCFLGGKELGSYEAALQRGLLHALTHSPKIESHSKTRLLD